MTREFLIESQEGLDRMERCLTDLEERPEDRELLAEIFRTVHTIKGTTGFLGFLRLESLAHAGENLLGLLRDGKLLANADIVSGLLALLDILREILGQIEASGKEGGEDHAAMIHRLNALQQPSTGENNAQTSGRSLEDVSLPEVCSSPHAAARKKRARKPKAASPAAITPLSDAEIARPQEESRAIEVYQAEPQIAQARAAVNAAESTLRVDVDLLNRMMNLVGELVLTRNQILQMVGADASLAMLSRRLDMVTADLREAVMKARMQPVSHVFSKFPRMVRDLAQQLSKRVRLVMEGQETELDKSLLEAIKDPLTHSVRNAIDHGIELPHLREAAGKDLEGTLRLRAYQEGSHVVIEVSDDGGGMKVERIRDKALERKLITRERAAQLSDRELMQLIFLPGFSTAEAITNVSGRGVGMDVVRTNVEKIGGKVEIDSRVGKGTTLRLRIPLTLAIVPALIVHSRGQSFALPQGALSELVHLSSDQVSAQVEWMEGAALYRLRGKLLPLIFLGSLLKQHTRSEEPREVYIAVLNAEGRRYGLVVDSLADPEEIVVKPLSSVLKRIGFFSGATVLGNGEMALILDPGAIATQSNIGMALEDDEPEVLGGNLKEGTAEYLLMQSASEHSAVPLDSVLRIERIPRGQMEWLNGIPVLRFDGTLLPLKDRTDVGAESPESEMTVVVCRDGQRHVGVAVTQVLDVAPGESLTEAGTNAATQDAILLKDKVTSIVDLRSIPALHGTHPLSGEFVETWKPVGIVEMSA
ncbi:chemotaxis protein CheA [Alloacidobacterium dinghuense]|uniref:histidine kinase n=1 Tax=Alloacidobacterium dinghuense TaxID=2763107 RepID=A0A7G8BL70_9BACT|nr:chemotaxis protein CheA [Alloacidobacterium dinghuense]